MVKFKSECRRCSVHDRRHLRSQRRREMYWCHSRQGLRCLCCRSWLHDDTHVIYYGLTGCITVLQPTICKSVSLPNVFIFYEVNLKGSVCFLKAFSWFNIGLFNLDWGFLFDSLTATMLIVVNTVSFLVHLYSVEYMRYDPFLPRFLSYLSLF